MKIHFSKKPDSYDYQGTPQFHSACGKYRLRHLRVGLVGKNGKAKIDEWWLHFNPDTGRKVKTIEWLKIHSIFISKKEAKHAANEHDLFLRAEKHVKKKQKGSRKSSKPLRRRR